MPYEWNPITLHMENRLATCWRLAAGTWTTREITGGSLEISEIRHAPGDRIAAAISGTEDENWSSTRSVVDEFASRVVPHAVWYCAPKFFGCESLTGTGWAGRAHTTGGIITLRTDQSERWTVSTAYHEAWHIIKHYLTVAERNAVDAAVLRGGAWSSAYYDSGIERRARAFEAYAMHRHEAPADARMGVVGRVMDVVHTWTLPEHERVLRDAYDGRIGRRAAARRLVSATRLSESARAQADAGREIASGRLAREASWTAIVASVAFMIGVSAWRWLV